MTRAAVLAGALLGLALLYLPLAAVALCSVNAARHGFAWEGFTLAWYARLLEDEAVLAATRTTLELAAASTLVSTLLGTLLAFGLEAAPWPRRARGALDALVDLPVITPDIVFAACLVIAFSTLRWATGWGLFQPGLPAMVLAHVTFQVAFVALVVRARLVLIEGDLTEAARDLYADRRTLLLRVTLPLVAPAVLAGALLAFTLSLDDFIISFFTAGPRSATLPIHIYAGLRRGLSPVLHALSTLIALAAVLLAFGLERVSRITT